MPCEKRKTRQVFAFFRPFRGAKPPFLYENPKKSGISSYVFCKTHAISPQVHDFYPTSIGIFVVALSLLDLPS